MGLGVKFLSFLGLWDFFSLDINIKSSYKLVIFKDCLVEIEMKVFLSYKDKILLKMSL